MRAGIYDVVSSKSHVGCLIFKLWLFLIVLYKDVFFAVARVVKAFSNGLYERISHTHAGRRKTVLSIKDKGTGEISRSRKKKRSPITQFVLDASTVGTKNVWRWGWNGRRCKRRDKGRKNATIQKWNPRLICRRICRLKEYWRQRSGLSAKVNSQSNSRYV